MNVHTPMRCNWNNFGIWLIIGLERDNVCSGEKRWIGFPTKTVQELHTTNPYCFTLFILILYCYYILHNSLFNAIPLLYPICLLFLFSSTVYFCFYFHGVYWTAAVYAQSKWKCNMRNTNKLVLPCVTYTTNSPAKGDESWEREQRMQFNFPLLLSLPPSLVSSRVWGWARWLRTRLWLQTFAGCKHSHT